MLVRKLYKFDHKKERLSMETKIEGYDFLTTKELESDLYLEKIKSAESETDGETLVALQNFLDYVKKRGGIRKDIFLYLLEHPVANKYYFAEILDLIQDNADIEWFKLIVKAQEHYNNGRFVIVEIMRAYETGIPVEDVAEYMDKARNPFEMSQYRCAYHNENEEQLNVALMENMSKLLEELLQENNKLVAADNLINKESEEQISQMQQKLKIAKEDSTFYLDAYNKEKQKNTELSMQINELEKLLEEKNKAVDILEKEKKEAFSNIGHSDVDAAVYEKLRLLEERMNHFENMKMLNSNTFGSSMSDTSSPVIEVRPEPQAEQEPVSNIVAGMEAIEEFTDSEPAQEVPGIDPLLEREIKNSNMTTNMEPVSKAMESDDNDDVSVQLEDVSDKEDIQEEMLTEKILLTDLNEQEEKSGKRLSFFSTLLKHHMRMQFLKLPEERQGAKLFEIMIGKGYGKKEIRLVRIIKDSGMNYEFLYNLIDSNVTLDKLEELVEAFAPSAASTLDTSGNGTDSHEFQSETDEDDDEMPFPEEVYI